MYKLILAEDEEDVRLGMVQEIDWTACGFEVVDTAENGKEAAELVEKWLPDVVVTDIRMPFMDGLQLSEWIRDQYPMTKIVILTGFDEFEYAQKAIKLHINEYVLKPFSAQELTDVLLAIRAEIDEESARKENIDALQEHYRKSLPVLREVFLASLMRRKLPRRDIEEKCLLYGIDLQGNGFAASVLSIDSPETDEGVERPNRGISLRDTQDTELKRFAVFNIAQELAHKHGLGMVFLHNGLIVMLTADSAGGDAQVLKKTLTVLEEIRHSVERYLNFTVTAGIGTVCADVADLTYSFKDALQALDYRLILGCNRLIAINDVETRFAEKLRFDELKEHALIRCLKVGTAQEMQETVEGLFEGIADTQVSVKDYQVYLLEIVTAMLKAAKESSADLESIFGPGVMPLAELHRFTRLEDAKAWVLGLCGRIAGGIANERQSSYKSLADQAKQYTLSHYHEQDISIAKVCGHLHISPGYFSSIFKRETKMTFGAYLMHIRMEAAKELLRTTDLKAFEIAGKVGYAEPNYFSFSFRKHVGVSPKEYRSGGDSPESRP